MDASTRTATVNVLGLRYDFAFGKGGEPSFLFFPINNQPDALIIQIYSVIKLYMFRASDDWQSSGVLYCTCGTGFMQVFFMTASKQSHPDSAWKLLMMGREDARNM